MQKPVPGPGFRMITDLQTDKKNRNRIQITLDTGVTFSVNVRKAGFLERGKFLDEIQIHKLQKEDAVDRCYQDAVRFLGYRARSRRELDLFLKKKAYSPETRDTVMNRMEKTGYVNDADYARIHVENRSRFSPRGACFLRHELRQKGIDDRIINRSLADLDENRLAFLALQKRMVHWKKLDLQIVKKKALSFLYGRGFPYEASKHAWEKTIQKPLSPKNDGV